MIDFAAALETFHRYIEKSKRWTNAPGIAVALTDRDGLLGSFECGYSDVVAARKLTSGDLFQIASMGKAFASIAVLRLQDEGILDIHAPLADYLPWFAVRSHFEPITLYHIMSHSAGMITGTEADLTAASEVWALRHTNASTPPGTYFHYSNVGYKIIGLILERVLGEDIGQIMREYVLDPIGMAESLPVCTNDDRGRLAVGYQPFYPDRPLVAGGLLAPAPWFEYDAADGAICSNTSDMARYLRFLLNGGGDLLKDSTCSLLFKPAIKVEDGMHGEEYALGLFLDRINGRPCAGHWGQMVGYRGSLLMDLESGLGVVILANGPWDSRDAARLAIELLRGEAADEEADRMLESHDPYTVANAADYRGEYRSEGAEIEIEARGENLFLHRAGRRVRLERRPGIGPDIFYANDPEYSRHVFRFGRRDGTVVDLAHGGQCYFSDGYEGSPRFVFPDRWLRYVGHYASHNPWLTNFRVVIRKGRLIWIQPDGQEEVLVAVRQDMFRVSDDPRNPERIRFGMFIDGKAHRADFSDAAYHRTFTP